MQSANTANFLSRDSAPSAIWLASSQVALSLRNSSALTDWPACRQLRSASAIDWGAGRGSGMSRETCFCRCRSAFGDGRGNGIASDDSCEAELRTAQPATAMPIVSSAATCPQLSMAFAHFYSTSTDYQAKACSAVAPKQQVRKCCDRWNLNGNRLLQAGTWNQAI